MKKNTLTKVLLPSLAVIALSGGAIAGATYALFTSDANTNIAITSGTVNVTSSLSGLELYSASLTDDDDTQTVLEGSHDLGPHSADYYHVLQTDGKFSNGGTGTLSGGDLTLTNMTAGDMAKATLNLTNNSNVAIKYRVVAECVNTDIDSLRLFAELEFSALGEDLSGVRKFVTSWEFLDAGQAIPATDVSVYLPLVSKLQDKATLIRFSIEAVQGNAYTKDEQGKYYIEFQDEEVTKTGDNLDDLEFTYGGTLTDPEVRVVVPASQNTIEAETATGERFIIVGDVLTSKITELKEGEPGTIVIGTEEAAKNYDISLYDQNQKKILSTTENITIEIDVGAGLDILEVQHDGNTVIKGVQTSGEYYTYDSTTGIITVVTSTFSPFNVKYAAPVVFEGDGTEANPYKVDSVRKFLAIDTFDVEEFGDIYYKLTDDIDLEEVSVEDEGYIWLDDYSVTLHLDLGGHTVSNIGTNLMYYGLEVEIKNGELIFDSVNGGSLVYWVYKADIPTKIIFQNLILSGSIESQEYHYGPLISYAYGKNDEDNEFETTCYNVTNNLVITNTVGGSYNGGFYGYVQGPYVKKIDIQNSSFNGELRGTKVGGFIADSARASAQTGFRDINIARITSTNNSLAGKLIGTASATAFGGKEAAADGNVPGDPIWNAAWNGSIELKDGYLITTQAPATDLVVGVGSMAKGDPIKISHSRDTAVKYLVSYEFWYRLVDSESGGYPTCIVQEIEPEALGEITTQFYNALIVDAEAEGESRVWYDATAKEYKFFEDGKVLYSEWATPIVTVQAYDANGVLIAYQTYTIDFAD